jgi:hypothetical protein
VEKLVATAQSGQLVCRIGSASANGVVYDMMLDKSAHAALKFFATGPQAENEVTIATFLSASVLATHSTRFPVVYGSATCSSANLDLTQPFAQEVREGHIKRRLLEIYSRSSTCKPATLKKLKRAPAAQSISEISALVSPAELATIQAETAFEVRVLLSEVCYSDVNYLIRHIDQPLRNAALFADFVMQTIDGLIVLYELRVVHKDIHFGNVLLKVQPDKSVLVLIHDFGTSQMNCEYYPDYMYDLERLMQCILVSGYFNTEVTAAREVIAAVSIMSEVKTAMQAVQNVFSVHYKPHCVDITLL